MLFNEIETKNFNELTEMAQEGYIPIVDREGAYLKVDYSCDKTYFILRMLDKNKRLIYCWDVYATVLD